MLLAAGLTPLRSSLCLFTISTFSASETAQAPVCTRAKTGERRWRLFDCRCLPTSAIDRAWNRAKKIMSLSLFEFCNVKQTLTLRRVLRNERERERERETNSNEKRLIWFFYHSQFQYFLKKIKAAQVLRFVLTCAEIRRAKATPKMHIKLMVGTVICWNQEEVMSELQGGSFFIETAV